MAVGAIRGEESATHGADPRAVFEIGSISKTFTSLMLAKMVVRGELALDRPVRELLPPGTAVPQRDGRDIELGHLACHISGLPRLPKGLMPRGMFAADPYAGCTEEVVLGGLAATRLRSVPGDRFHYSNLGAGVLGIALARHAGVGYEDLVHAEICRPLGMADTRVVLDEEQTARLAPGHSRFGRSRSRWRLAALAGAGGLASTVTDMLRLARATFGDAPEELVRAFALTRDTVHPLRGPALAHPGWISLPGGPDREGPRTLFHNGGTGGYRSIMAVVPERRTAVVILSADARSVDRPGLTLLADLGTPEPA